MVALAGGLGVAMVVLYPESGKSPATPSGGNASSVRAANSPPWVVAPAAPLDSSTDPAADLDPVAAAGRLASLNGENISVQALSESLRSKNLSGEERVFVCQQLALCGTAEAMQTFFETVVAEQDAVQKKNLCGALDLLTNEEGIEAATSVAATTGDPVILNAVEDCLSRCASAETVAYLAELHRESATDETAAGRIRSMLEGAHSSRAIPALGGLLHADTPPELFRSAALALSKSGGRESARALVAATRLQLSPDRRAALREIITSSFDDGQFEVFRDELTENPDDYWKSAYTEALEKDIH